MKKILSALTALCMCASMTVGVLPASALDALAPADAVIAKASGYEWAIDNVVFDPAADEYIEVPINVYNDAGTYGIQFGILIDGKSAEDPDFPFVLAEINKGEAYKYKDFVVNEAKGSVASSLNGEDNQYAKDGAAAVYLVFLPKDGVDYAPGTRYELTFGSTDPAKEMKFAGFDGVPHADVTLTAGSITIPGGTAEESTESTQSSDSTEPDASESTAPPVSDGYKWDIEEVEFNPESDPYIEVPINVYNDAGTYGIQFGILVDGKSAEDPDFPFVLAEINKGEAYKYKDFVVNEAKGSVASSLNGEDSQYAENGATAVYLVFLPKDGVNYAPGTTYKLTFGSTDPAKEMKFAGFDGVPYADITLEAGAIIIPGGDQPDTSEPVESDTTTPQPDTTEPLPTDTQFVEQEKQVDAEWIIGNATVEPGEEVFLNVSVNGNKDGFNSYMTKLKMDSAVGTKNAGKRMDNLSFAMNLENNTFGGTSFTTGKENITEDGAVFAVRFVAPTKPGKYIIDFETLDVYDANMVKLIPKKTAGWIEVIGEESTEPETEFVHDQKNTSAKWIIGKYEDAEPGQTVQIPVSVQGDKDGLNSYTVKINQDAGSTATKASAGEAYAELGFESNLADLTFGGTNSSKGENIVAPDGDVFYIEFKVPEDAAPGALYNLKFADIDLEDISMTRLIPQTEDGWIKVKSQKPVESAGKWIIGKKTVEAGAQVTIPVYVEGDVNGLNSYIMKMGMDAGPIVLEAGNGDHGEFSFVSNIDNMTFAGTDYTTGDNIHFNDSENVFLVTFTAPNEPGKYNLTFADLEVYDINMSILTPETEDGWIEVIAPSEEVSESKELQNDRWIISHETVGPGEEVVLNISVEGNTDGFNSYIAKLDVDSNLTIKNAGTSDSIGSFSFESNLDDAIFGGTSFTVGSENVVGDGKVFGVRFVAPMEPGIYPVEFDGLTVYNADMNLLDPEQINGWVEVVAPDTTEPESSEPDTTEPDTTEPESSEPDTTEPDTTEPEPDTTEPIVPDDAGMWIIGTATVEPGATVTIPVSVTGDKNGLNSYLMKMGVVPGPVATDAANGEAYDLSFVSNIDNMTFAGTNPDKGENLIAGDDTVVFYVTFTAPMEEGTYDLTFDGLEVYDINMSLLDPLKQNGWIKVVAPDTTEPESSEPDTTEPEPDTSEPDTTEPEPDTTEPESSEPDTTEPDTTEPEPDTTEPIVPDDAGMWIIGTATVEPGATVTIPVSVTGDKNGLNSYLMKMGVVPGPVATDAANGEAYDLSFVSNIDNMTFAGTNPDKGENLIAGDDAVVFYVTFTAPMEEGTYDLTFDGLEVYDINMSLLDPLKQNGWIKVVAPDTTEPESSEPDTTEPEPDTSEPDTTEPEPDTSEPDKTEPEPDTSEPELQNDRWIISHETVGPGEEVVLNISVEGNTDGFNSYIVKLDVDSNLTVKNAGTSDSIGDFSFVSNLEDAIFGGTSFTVGSENISGDGKIFGVRFVAPMEPGIYPVEFDGLTVYDADMNLLDPEQINGWIEVVAPDTTEPESTEPESTEPESTEPESTEPESTEPESTEPESTEPESTEPESTEPESTEPESTEPESTEPESTEPESTEPESTEPESTEPDPSESDIPPVSESDNPSEKPEQEINATWEVAKQVAFVGDKNVKVAVSVTADDLAALNLNAFDFTLDIQDGPTYKDFEWGSAYALMTDKQKAADAFRFMGENSSGVGVQAANASTVINLIFDIPEDLEPGIYAINFNGDVQAIKMDMSEVDVEEVDGYIRVLPAGTQIPDIEYQYNIEGKSKFYFAHDHRAFDVNDLLSMATLRRRVCYIDNETGELVYTDWTIANELDGISFVIPEQDLTFKGKTYHLSSEEAASPKGIYDAAILPTVTDVTREEADAYFRSPIKFNIQDTTVEEGTEIKFVKVAADGSVTPTDLVTGDIFIGVKGDTSLNGITNAYDSSLVLKYAASVGAGQMDTKIGDSLVEQELVELDDMLENFIFFLSDVTGESEDHGEYDSNGNYNEANALNADDSSRILVYAAQAGAGIEPDWYTILDEPLPRYTKAIGPLPENAE